MYLLTISLPNIYNNNNNNNTLKYYNTYYMIHESMIIYSQFFFYKPISLYTYSSPCAPGYLHVLGVYVHVFWYVCDSRTVYRAASLSCCFAPPATHTGNRIAHVLPYDPIAHI